MKIRKARNNNVSLIVWTDKKPIEVELGIFDYIGVQKIILLAQKLDLRRKKEKKS